MRILREPSQRLPRRPGRSRTNRSAHVPAPSRSQSDRAARSLSAWAPAVRRLPAGPIAHPSVRAAGQIRHNVKFDPHRSPFEWRTTPSLVEKMQFTGQTDAQGASVQCMHAIETERSPGLPSLMLTTRRRLMPHGTSFSFLQAVTQALQSMQRSASQRNFIRAMVAPPHAARI